MTFERIETKLGELLEDIAMGPFGSDIKADNFVEVGVPVLRGQNLNDLQVDHSSLVFLTEEKADALKRSNAFPGDLVITHRGTLGQVSVIQENSRYTRYVVSQSQMRLTVDREKLNPLYLAYWLRGKEGQHRLLSYATQTGVPAISRPTNSLKSLEVPLIPIEKQNSIVNVLGAFDDKIAANKLAIDAIEKLCLLLYKQVSKSMSQTTFAEKVEVFGGSTPSTKNEQYWGGDIAWATPTDLTGLDGTWVLETERKISEAGLKAMSSSLHPEDSILMTSRATIGAIALAATPITTNQGFIVVRAPHELTPWVFYQMKDRVSEFIAWANGATFLELSRGNFKKLKFVECTESDLAQFNEIVWPLLKKSKALQIENKNLAQTRDELLPLLMSGKVTVSDVGAVGVES